MMASFKMTIAEDTPLWKEIGGLSSKARNAELYRLATTGLIAQLHSHSAIVQASSGQGVQKPVQSQVPPVSFSEPFAETTGGFFAVDFGEDLQFLTGN
jgi:hypothetical protein